MLMLLIHVLLALRICFGTPVDGMIRVDSVSHLLNDQSCVPVKLSPGRHEILVKGYGFPELDTTVYVGTTDTIILLHLPLYRVDSVISTPRVGSRSFLTFSHTDYALQPTPLFHDPLLMTRSLPFVVCDAMVKFNLKYSAALGRPDENLVSIEGVPVPVFQEYPHSLVPLPLVKQMSFYLLDIPLNIGWTLSSHLDIRLPADTRDKKLYFDPFGSIAYSNISPMKGWGIEFYTLYPALKLLSKGGMDIHHVDIFSKNVSTNRALTFFGMAEIISMGGKDVVPSNTKISDFGFKMSHSKYTVYLAGGFYSHKQPEKSDNIRVVLLGINTQYKRFHLRLNLVNEMQKSIATIFGIANPSKETFEFSRNSLFTRAWFDIATGSIIMQPYLDFIVYKRILIDPISTITDTSGLLKNASPGIKLRLNYFSYKMFYISTGVTNQFFKLVKNKDALSLNPDTTGRTFYLVTGFGNMRMFFRHNIDDSLVGFGYYGKFQRMVGERSGLALSIWGMHSFRPDKDFGLNFDIMVSKRWNEKTYWVMRLVQRMELFFLKGQKEPGFFRLDVLLMRNFRIRSHESSLYMGIYNLLSKNSSPSAINFPVPTFGLSVKF